MNVRKTLLRGARNWVLSPIQMVLFMGVLINVGPHVNPELHGVLEAGVWLVLFWIGCILVAWNLQKFRM